MLGLRSQTQALNPPSGALQAATGAGMRCIITWTLNTKSANFDGAERIVETLDGTAGVSGPVTISELLETPAGDVATSDDRLLVSTVKT